MPYTPHHPAPPMKRRRTTPSGFRRFDNRMDIFSPAHNNIMAWRMTMTDGKVDADLRQR